MMTPLNARLSWLQAIAWQQSEEVTASAKELIRSHIELVRPILVRLIASEELSASEAHDMILTPAPDSKEYQAYFSEEMEDFDLPGCSVPEQVLMTVAAHGVWHLDPDLSSAPNPWEPIMGLYRLGYPTSYLDTPEHDGVSLQVGLQDGVEVFLVHGEPCRDEDS